MVRNKINHFLFIFDSRATFSYSNNVIQKLKDHKIFKENSLINEIYTKIEIQNSYEISQENFKKLTLIISSIRNLRSELNIPYKHQIKLNINNKDENFCNFIKSSEIEIVRLLKLSELSLNDLTIKNINSANLIIANSTLIIPLTDIIDAFSELKKLNNKKNKEIIELQKIQNKLKNHKFIEKAPVHIVADYKKQEIEIKSSIEKIDQIINTIN